MFRFVAAACFTTLALTAPTLASPVLGSEPLPSFSAPTEISNPFAPFLPDSAKVFRGRREGARTTVIESHLVETRDFLWQGETVVTRILQEKEFEQGVLVEIARTYLAQANDGSVWAFGEVAVEFEDGTDIGPEDDAWLVGGPTEPQDPLGIQAVLNPSLFMPAELIVGMVFSRESFPGGAETLEVVGVELKQRTPAGKFVHAVRLLETGNGEEPPTHLWLAPGVGLIIEKEKHQRSKLIATSLLESEN